MSLTFSRYVRFIFHVCPVLSSPVVPIGFLVLCFPFIPLHSPCFVSLSFPCTPLVFISVPVMSLSVPLCFPFVSRCFPIMSTFYFPPSFPWTSLHFPFARQYHVPSIPFNSPFMPLTFSRYVRFIFHVCPVLSLRVICRLVSSCFVSLSFSCTPLALFPFQFPFVSLSFPVAFLSCRLPISSPHFLALPCISPLLPSISRNKHGFPAVQKHRVFQIFGKRRQKPKPAKSRQGNRAGPPKTERHQITARYVGDPPPPSCTLRIRRRAGGGVRGGGVILYPLLGVRHAEQCWRT